VFSRFRDVPLRVQLMLVFALLSVATTAITAITLTSLAERRQRDELQVKSAHYSRQLQQQLQTILEPSTRLTAHELFESLAGDDDVDGLGVYLPDGELIASVGKSPQVLDGPALHGAPDEQRLATVVPITVRDRLASRLYVGLSSAPIEAQHRHDIWLASGIASGVVLGALGLAVVISRRIARRLVAIAAAANRMAAGDLAPIRLDESAQDEIGNLAHSFNVMVTELNRLSADHEQLVRTERERLERLVEERTEALESSREMFRLIAESTRATPFTLDQAQGSFPYIGQEMVESSGVSLERWQQPGALDILAPRESNAAIRHHFDVCAAGLFEFEGVLAGVGAGAEPKEMRFSGTCEVEGDARLFRGLMQDVTEMRRLERELAAAQKLESIGRLAAGVAHEINTPLQFVTDNVQFVRTGIDDLKSVVAAYRSLQTAAAGGDGVAAAVRAAQDAEQAADLDYLLENTPLAIGDAVGGLQRITTIVRSMKEFAHPDQAQKACADLNHAITSTLVVAHNEYKYVANLETDFEELPLVMCHLGEINQVVLNLVVNAAHAIADVVRDTGALGTITVRTRRIGPQVEISIADTGGGIPESVREKIFDPFFTTKEVGKGTGQGLAIARTVVVKKHQGSLRFESEMGVGTTFYIHLPINSPTEAEDGEAAAA
jgi:signal transduction histidine kinase/HAMP domain-containing protein